MVEALDSSQVEKPAGILHRITEGLTSFYRGYSEKDLNNARRTISGNITPEDREKFIGDEISRVGLLGTELYFAGFSNIGIPGPAIGVSNLMEEMKRIQALPEEEINRRIAIQAEENLRLWGKF